MSISLRSCRPFELSFAVVDILICTELRIRLALEGCSTKDVIGGREEKGRVLDDLVEDFIIGAPSPPVKLPRLTNPPASKYRLTRFDERTSDSKRREGVVFYRTPSTLASQKVKGDASIRLLSRL